MQELDILLREGATDADVAAFMREYLLSQPKTHYALMSPDGLAQNAMASQNAMGGAPYERGQPSNEMAYYNLANEQPPQGPVAATRARATMGDVGAVIADAGTMGTIPYMAGAASEDPGKARREGQLRIAGARERVQTDYPGATSIIDTLTPMAGAGLAMQGVKTPGQAVRRAGMVGGAYGGVRGYFSDVESDAGDVGARLQPALMDAAISGAMTAGGAKAAQAAPGMAKAAQGFMNKPQPAQDAR